MPIAKMQKVRVLGLKRQRRQVLDLIQDMGVMQIEEVEAVKPGLAREISYDPALSDLEFAIKFLERFEVKKKGFLDSLAGGRRMVSYQEVKKEVGSTIRMGLAKGCRSLQAQLINLGELEKNLLREKDLLQPWKGLSSTLEEIASSDYVRYFTGMITLRQLEALRNSLGNLPAAVQVVNSDKLNTYVLIATPHEDEEEVQKRLAKNAFIPIKLPLSHRTPEEEIRRIDVSLDEERERREGLLSEAASLAGKRFELMLVHDFFLQKKEAQGAEKKLSLTPYTFTVEGWVVSRELKLLRGKLDARFPESIVLEIEGREGEDPPVAIENGSIIRPFEAVTGIYGLPSYREVDPAPFLATFFIIFFGLCLGDAGYGITLTIVAYLFYKKARPTSGARKIFRLLIYGGVVTFIAGSMTGGWFGVGPEVFPEFIKPVKDFFLSIRVIDPIKDPMGMLILALSLGIVQIIFGIMVDFYIKIRDRRFLDAILGDLLWVYFLLALVAFVIQKTGTIFVSGKIAYLVIGGAVALVLTQGRKHKNPLLMLGSGILSLYKTVGYLSDVLSYSRILALGLASSIIAMVVNMVAMMTKDTVPVLGYVIMVLILIGGHTFNLAVNILGSFIHSARLQFVEFFSKFLQGGGDEFRPFRRGGKFVEIIDLKTQRAQRNFY